MTRVCQEPCGLFALLVAVSLAPAVMFGSEPPTRPVPTGISAHLIPWTPRSFADIALEDPDLASCYLLSPGLWSSAAPPKQLDEAVLGSSLATQLRGLVDPEPLPLMSITIGTTDGTAVDTVVHGSAAVVLVPKAETPGPAEVARNLAPAILAANIRPATPDLRCAEPLLAVAEALVDSGSLALAALPPTLRPVRDWLEFKDAVPTLTAFATDALDPATHWQSRRASMAGLRQVGGANPQLAAATALLVEAFGKGNGKEYPPMPRVLRNALAKPLEAGLPKEKEKTDREEVDRDARARLVGSGAVTLADVAFTSGLPIRLEVAARLRAKGEPGLCEWLTSGQLPRMRTGCRGDGEEGGLVFARPRSGGFEIVWKPPGGDEGVLVVWPRWVLFPVVAPTTGELWLIDSLGVWRVALNARTAPHIAAAGSFRHLAVAPDGAAAACARWPGGEVVAIQASGVRELAVNGRGGVVWLDIDMLVASDGESLSLASLQGETRPGIFALPCCRGLISTSGGLVAGVSPPCNAGLVRVALTERVATPLLRLPDAPLGMVPIPGGGIALGLAEGLMLWRGEGTAERIGSGLTPGPG
jgi:hypothetical protein